MVLVADVVAEVKMKKIKLTISGMHCASCAGNVERSLKKVSGVKSVSVSLMTNKSIVELEDSVSDEDLKKAVSKTGYKVVDVQAG
jgi:Cu+-exporting ATPase